MHPLSFNCPNCGAPLPVTPQNQIAICVYCSSSVRLGSTDVETSSAPPEPVIQDVPKEAVEQVLQMVAEGKRIAAFNYYAERSGLPLKEAEEAVNRIAIPLIKQITQHVPLNLWGIVLGIFIVCLLTGGVLWSLGQALAGLTAFWFIVFILFVMLVRRVMWLAPKLLSTWVSHFGTLGQASILKTAVIRPGLRAGGTLVTVLLEIQPGGEHPSFQDQETWLVRDEALYKVQPGSLIQVRYDSLTRERVFPLSPIRVWDAQRGEFVS